MTTVSNYSQLLEAELKNLVDPVTGLLATENSRLIDCPLCNDVVQNQKELFIKRGYRFVVCPKCDLVFSNPMVNPEITKGLYEGALSLKESAKFLKSDSQLSFDTRLYSSAVDLARPLMNRGAPCCLDISMRGGLAAECGLLPRWDIDFFDFCWVTRDIGKTRNPSRTFFDSFSPIMASGRKYSMVISMEAMEQFHNPSRFLQNVAELLHEGGVFCGVLSNVESLLVRILGQEAPLFDGLYQKFFFHTGSLNRLFSLTGFDDGSFETAVPCRERITSHLNRMLCSPQDAASKILVEEISRYADLNPLGYKLFFATVKK